MLFVNVPIVAEVTSIVTVHVPPAGIIAAPSSSTDTSPPAAVTMPFAQVVCAFGATSVTIPLPFGNESSNGLVRLMSMPFGLPMVITSVLVLPAEIRLGAKFFANVGGTNATLSVASAATAFAPSLVCNAPAGMSFG